MSREQWTVQNITKKEVALGDLFRVPSLPPGKTIDLLNFHNTAELNQSSDLHHLINIGWLRLTKTAVVKNPIPHTIEEDELNRQTDFHIVTTAVDFAVVSDTRIIEVVLVNAANTNIVITLPSAATTTNHAIYIKKVDTTAHVVTVDPNAAETIDLETTQIITEPFDTMKIFSDGTGWWII